MMSIMVMIFFCVEKVKNVVRGREFGLQFVIIKGGGVKLLDEIN